MKLPIGKMIFGVFGAIIALVLVFGTWFTTELGYNYVVQNTWTGNTTFYSEPGTHIKMPFFTRVTEYKQAATINFAGVEGIVDGDTGDFTRNESAVEVAFADTYTGDIPVSFRFRLPRSEPEMLKIHEEFRSFDNMVDSLLTKNARDVMVNTAQQYTGEEFFQGGLNQYKVQLTDQLRDGIYETKRTQVVVEDVAALAVSSSNSDATSLQETQRKVWKNVIQRDSNGAAIRLESPLEEYGIIATQATIGKPEPSARLNSLLENKRELVATRIGAIEQLQTAEAQAAAVQQQEEIEKRRQIQIAQREKELAVIAGQQAVAVAREEANRQTVERNRDKSLAVIDKQRELEIAEANRGIQRAAAEAAVFQANAIREIGLAEAEVDQAKLEAKQAAADIYMAEIQRDIARVMYPALRDVTIDMPDFYNSGSGDGKVLNSLDVFTTLGALDQLQSRKSEPVVTTAD
jgi:hypothetical protein